MKNETENTMTEHSNSNVVMTFSQLRKMEEFMDSEVGEIVSIGKKFGCQSEQFETIVNENKKRLRDFIKEVRKYNDANEELYESDESAAFSRSYYCEDEIRKEAA